MRLFYSFILIVFVSFSSFSQGSDKKIRERLYEYIEDTTYRDSKVVRDLLSKRNRFNTSSRTLLEYTTIVLKARELSDKKGNAYSFEDYTPTLIKLLKIIEQWETDKDLQNLNFAYGNIARALYDIEIYEYSIIYFKRKLKLKRPDKHYISDLYKLSSCYLKIDQEVQNTIYIILQYWPRIAKSAGEEKDSVLFEFNQLLIEANYEKKQYVESLTRIEQNIRYAEKLSIDRKIEAYVDLAELKHRRKQNYEYLFEILQNKYGNKQSSNLDILEAQILFEFENDIYDKVPNKVNLYLEQNTYKSRGKIYLDILRLSGNVKMKNKKFRKAYKAYKEILGEYGNKLNGEDRLETYGNISYCAIEIGKNKDATIYYKAFVDYKFILDEQRRKKEKNIQDLMYWFRNAKNAVEFSSKQNNIELIMQQKDSLYQAEQNRIQTEAESKRRRTFNIAMIAIIIIVILFLAYAYNSNRKNNKLLRNILPEKIAKMLKSKERIYALRKDKTPMIIDEYKMATVLFTDFRGFTSITESLEPEELVEKLNICFAAFDKISKRNNLEKIKTIGDSYMCAGGIPEANSSNPIDAVNGAIEMIAFIEKFNEERRSQNKLEWEIRVGINTGHILAGIIGRHKYSYDVWGDTVNLASRMESSGEPGKINISENTYQLVRNQFDCTYRGEVKAKNKGEVKMYFVEGKK